MKKIIVSLLSLFVLVSAASAIEFSADVNFTMPMQSFSGSDLFLKDYTEFDFGTGFDFGISAMVNKRFGAKVDLGLNFPQNYKRTYKESGNKTDINYNSELKAYNAFSIFAGPKINITSTKNYSVTVIPGILMQFYTAETKPAPLTNITTTTKWSEWGAGAEIQATYTISTNLYANFACPLVWKFSKSDDNGSKDLKVFYFQPKFGIGYKFK